MLYLLSAITVFAQDTLRISLADAQKAFTDKNLQLISEKYNIDASKAQIIQAKLFANPTVNIEQGIITRPVPVEDKVIGAYGQHAVQVQQLILLAGKRNKNITMAKINAQISEYEFYDLLRTLSYSLNSNFFELAYQLKTMQVYSQEITTIERLVNAYQQLQQNGNAALKDVVRLESVLFSLESDLNEMELAVAENQADLRVLLGISTDTYIMPVINTSQIDSINMDDKRIEDLISIAEENRYDLKATEANVKLANTNLSLQKATRVPDIVLGYMYDRASSYTTNYSGITLQTNLPLFNRNQGNIKMADYQLKSNEKNLELAHLSLKNDVILAYTQTRKTETLYKNFDKNFVRNFNQLIKGVIEGYENKTISLVEFMDFFDSYKQNVVQFNTLRNNRVQSYLRLNYSVAKELFTF